MAPYNKAPRAGDPQGSVSAHGRNGFGSQTILPSFPSQLRLTDGQQQAFDLLSPIFRGESPGAQATLTGFAGTGKTTLTARLSEQSLTSIPGAEGVRDQRGRWEKFPALVVAAPTHKAARQLERAMDGCGIKLKAVTLHSALGLRPVRDGGQEVFQPDPTAKCLIGEHTRLVVVDETSMVSAELTTHLLDALPSDAALVAIGDPAQLQPVGDPTLCPLFEAAISAHLSEVVRHAGPILELATATRELGSGRPVFRTVQGTQSAITAYGSFPQWRKAALRACIEANRTGNTDAARVLSWTNAAADKFNRELHKAIYGINAPPYVVGQPVVSSNVILGPDGSVIVGSTCEMQLLEVTPGQGAVHGDELLVVREALLGKRKSKAGELIAPWKWFDIRAQVAGSTGMPVEFRVLNPDPEQLLAWRKANNAIAALAKEEKEADGKDAAKPTWNIFWARKDRFGAINPVWSLTIHKAQGSTFEQVFLHPDLDRNQEAAGLNQLAYVGMTRASMDLHVVADRQPQQLLAAGRAGVAA
ncbi:AAA family ATPase [Cyanobium gracile UHCC 0139]|uniref:AAA family ATPase n=1 Tax=Cyanobium gracile UHCC 0139 TaxID=3110308 RepID=A0ABU5RTN0_9CYAN|nr:AAA family ATPase [Cyanobium gracile]MEA5391150.1 AAA family ATPase [Cyanobium gracile UHCC 0139]